MTKHHTKEQLLKDILTPRRRLEKTLATLGVDTIFDLAPASSSPCKPPRCCADQDYALGGFFFIRINCSISCTSSWQVRGSANPMYTLPCCGSSFVYS